MHRLDITVKSNINDNSKIYHFDSLSTEFVEGFRYASDTYTSGLTGIPPRTVSFTTDSSNSLDMSHLYIISSCSLSLCDIRHLQSNSNIKRQKVWSSILSDYSINNYRYIALISHGSYVERNRILFNSVDVLSGIRTFIGCVTGDNLYIIAILDMKENIQCQFQYCYRTEELVNRNNLRTVYPTVVLCLRRRNVADVAIVMILKFLLGNKLNTCESYRSGISQCITKTSNDRVYCKLFGVLVEACELYGNNKHEHDIFRKCDVCSGKLMDPVITTVTLVND